MRAITELIEARFETLHERATGLLDRLRADRLMWRPASEGLITYSAGEFLVRSAAAVEQTFGGLTRRLWDDPFEWTLPEELSDHRAIAAYLDEVRETRIKGFEFILEDEDLFRMIPAPETLTSIANILLATLEKAAHLQGRAYGVAQEFIQIGPNRY
jgi:hypothetical protein